jgi:hypothetical protein
MDESTVSGFLCFSILFGVPLFILVMLALGARQKGQLNFQPWALPVFLASVLLSCPLNFTTFGWGFLSGTLLGHTNPALWIMEACKTWGWLCLFLWPVALVLILQFNGLTFSSRQIKRDAIAILLIILLPLGLLDAGGWCAIHLWDWARESEVAQAASPDGRLRIHVLRVDGFDGSDYVFVLESNRAFPLLSQRLCSVDVSYGHGGSHHASAKKAGLIWSKDSQVVAMWPDDVTAMAYDFSRGTSLVRNDTPGADESSEATEKRLDRLMADHGGPAPPK